MAAKEHHYEIRAIWRGDAQTPNTNVQGFSRSHQIELAGKPALDFSSDPNFQGDPGRNNPEEMLVASLSSCHMLWYLVLCGMKGIVVTDYDDRATGTMLQEPGKGRFTEVTLHPRVTVAKGSDIAQATKLHERAHKECFIANSVNFPVNVEPDIIEADG
jgi:organic hydroperoxide reductase OsmC/OhrA